MVTPFSAFIDEPDSRVDFPLIRQPQAGDLGYGLA
jgi:hypothetical protein